MYKVAPLPCIGMHTALLLRRPVSTDFGAKEAKGPVNPRRYLQV